MIDRTLLAPLAQLLLLVLVAPLFGGLVRRIECWLLGTAGPRLSEPLWRLAKLLGQSANRPPSKLHDAAAALAFGATVSAAGLLPAVLATTPIGAGGGVLAFAGLLGLGRAAQAFAALDASGSAPARGGAIAAFLAALAEPALVLACLALTLASGSGELDVMTRLAVDPTRSPFSPTRLLSGAALVLVALQASCALAPSRALRSELEPAPAAMLGAAAGPRRGLLELTGRLRELTLWLLFVDLLLPHGIAADLAPLSLALGLAVLTVKLAAIAAGVALARVAVARLRLARDAEIAAAAFALAALALVFAETGGA